MLKCCFELTGAESCLRLLRRWRRYAKMASKKHIEAHHRKTTDCFFLYAELKLFVKISESWLAAPAVV